MPIRFILILTFALLPTIAKSQWVKIATFPRHVQTVYFMSDVGKPNIGYSATIVTCRDTQYFWRTVDGGKTWLPNLGPFELCSFGVSDITFTDSLIGWLADDVCNRSTTNGGTSWSALPSLTEENNVAIAYSPITRLLFSSTWATDHSRVSSDKGLTWTKFAGVHAGFTFSGKLGVLNPADYFPPIPALYTTDGGLTWSQSNLFDECWQPACFQGSSIFFAASEHMNRISRSDDGGKTWRVVYTFAPAWTNTSNIYLSGCVRADPCNNLYIQSRKEGVLVSSDSGLSWRSIGGPSGYTDTRFWITDEYIYAGESAVDTDLYKTGSLWRYRINCPPTPVLRVQGKTIASSADTSLTINITTATDSITGFDTVHYVLRYDDAFELEDIVPSAGWRILDSSTIGGALDVWIVGDGNPLRSNLLTLTFKTALEKSSAKIYLDSAHFYGPKRLCDRGELAIAPPDSIEIDFNACGDSTLLRFMASGSLVGIDRVTPNPAGDFVRVEGRGLRVEDVQVYDVMGRRVALPQPLPQAGGELVLDVRSMADGVYYLRIGTASTRFVIQR